MKLDFICIGAQKAGTTTLHEILKQHPDIYLPERKEAHFFDQEERFQKGTDWWWNNFFANNYKNQRVKGVITPEYLYFKEVPNRIYTAFGADTKIIVILRDPIDRAYSHYLMSKRRGYEKLSFEEAIFAEPNRIQQGEFERNHFSYIDRGRYLEQLKRYYSLFNPDNILTLVFEEDIKLNLQENVQKIEHFLNVDPLVLNTKIKSNQASEPKSMRLVSFLHQSNKYRSLFAKLIPSDNLKYKIKTFLVSINQKPSKQSSILTKSLKDSLFNQYFSDEVKQIELLIGRDLECWYKF